MPRKRKSAITKEPKPETESKEEQQQNDVLPNKDDKVKSTDETVDKPVPQPPLPPPEVSSEFYYSAEQVIEYQWPPDRTGEFYLLRHQVCQFLETEDLEEKYPELERHILAEEEKEYLQEKGAVNDESQDLVAFKTEDVCQLMIDSFPKKFQEYIRVTHNKERQRLIKKTEEEKKALETRKVANYIKRAIKDAAEFNAQLAQQRREERCSYFDMQTQIIHVPVNKTTRLPKHCTKPSLYPVSLLPGQFQEYYKRYTPEELKNFPLGTVLEMPTPPLPPAPYIPPQKDESAEESDDISLPESTADESDAESSEEEIEEPPVKRAPGKYKPPKRPNALCGICLKGSDSNKKGFPEDLIHCSQCENSGHPSCLDMNVQLVAVIQTYPWQCMECKTCIICRDPFDEDKMLFCDECDRGYHSFCVGLKQIPVGKVKMMKEDEEDDDDDDDDDNDDDYDDDNDNDDDGEDNVDDDNDDDNDDDYGEDNNDNDNDDYNSGDDDDGGDDNDDDDDDDGKTNQNKSKRSNVAGAVGTKRKKMRILE